mgnify:FL=1
MNTARFPVRSLVLAALMAAVLCILAPLSVPVGPIPLSFATLAIYFIAYLLGWKWGTASVLVYVLLGAVGLPVFSGYSGGMGKVLGPTGGYIVGYLFLAVIAGLVIQRTANRFFQLLGMLAGTAVLYAFGTAWYCFQSGVAVGDALMKCVWIFIPGDLIKMAAALTVGPVLRRRLEQAKSSS